jgi:Flp pilus assembly protein TadD
MIVEYLRRAVWPRSLVLDYGEPVPYALTEVLVPGLAVLALLGATVWALARRPAIGFLAACFFIILAPTSSVIPIATEVGAERRMYLPLAALIALAVGILARTGRRGRPVRIALTGVAALLLAAGTIDRNREYQVGLTLWQSTLERRPTARAHRNVATELKRAGRPHEALAHLRQSVTPAHPEARYALGYELFEQGQHAAAVEELSRFIRENPDDANIGTAHTLIANALLKEMRYAEAVPHLEAAAGRRPDVAQGWITLGVTLAQAEEMPRAEAALRKGVSLAPRDGTARMMLGLVLAAQGRLAEAAAELRVATTLDPANADAREHLRNVEALLARTGGP